ncbi:bifunctional thiamine biosynthesis ThiD [Abyssogena phaseoliformis symbiont OG214]|uniref:bifunctional hydroxymethylpyrimidine kinase/phosphomethylpyrimidine kinase n=1 Tax=Abyssogena phaseoliformis symbiont TaxID=596095 RepID=UPI0019163543|nr:hydroxymethylpyrimidine/phosphomethylpyrimidine kinase [Abyssogena phaseoliformis symbiont]MBW5289805.1 Hydroxymethylpyrimidine phosphate kinase ThiD [Candidatus Ruthia sp. Apha_13_S6]BBB23080.1 bifunctional thiamine biosynthesis ThiD [Abyssogena phaseoliformis symbiont OG214]
MNNAVLVLSGLDPCGGAGLVADIESINQFGVTPLVITTNLTVQNTASVESLVEVDCDFLIKQFKHLQADVDFEVVKIGLLSSIKQIKTIAKLAKNKTIILDPIVKSSSDYDFLDSALIDALKQQLLPLAKVITPNLAELQILADEQNEQKAIKKLFCNWILLTKTDVSDDVIEHRLYHHETLVQTFIYQKLPGSYHGSGCTLSSVISALIASDLGVEIACKRALDYTYQTLLNAKSIGKMQYHPNRQSPS